MKGECSFILKFQILKIFLNFQKNKKDKKIYLRF